MRCQYCGKELSSCGPRDGEFCDPAHRRRFMEGGAADGPVPPRAGWLPVGIYYRRSPAESSGGAQWGFPPVPVVKPAFALRLVTAAVHAAPARPWRPAHVAKASSAPARNRARLVVGSRHMALAALVVICGGIISYINSTTSRGAHSLWGAKTSSGDPRTFSERLASRALTELNPNLRSGTHCWMGASADWSRSWFPQADGSVWIGDLALYRPSLDLANYRFEFVAQIEQQSVGWVVRARDMRNYYAVKFNIVQRGPRPLVSVTRYPVQGGVKGDPKEVATHVVLRDGAPYRMSVRVQGDTITTFVDEQRLDSWTDERIPSGGVGFFRDTGDRALLYWAKLYSNDDFLGQVCAFFFGKRPDGFLDDGHPIFCGSDSRRRLVGYPRPSDAGPTPPAGRTL